jgi:ATP-dependent Clp protease ATP-binding subunit ClpC
MSRYERYADRTIEILKATQDIARRESKDSAGLSDLSRALLIEAIPEILEIARENDSTIDRDKLKALYASIAALPQSQIAGKLGLAEDFRSVLAEAEKIAGNEKVRPEHLIHAAWPSIKEDVAAFFASPDGLPQQAARAELTLPDIESSTAQLQAIQVLENFGRELTSKERSFSVFGRDEEIDNLISVLIKFFKPNPLVIGEPGVGKTALVEGLAERIKRGDVPTALKGVRIFEIRVSDLAAGTNVHGAFEERMRQLIAAVEANPNVIVFLDEIHQIAQSYGNEPTADILKPALSKGRFRCIGATTVADYHRFLEKDDALLRRFQTVFVKEPDRQTVRVILNGLKPALEAHYGIDIPWEILDRVIALSGQYLSNRYYPDKAIDVLDRACSKASFKRESLLGERHLREAISDIAGIRFESDLADATGLDRLEARIREDIVGQDEAVASVCNVLKICKKHLDLRPERPDGAFLFVGPTGVGKTALAESLARHIAGRDDALYRIDMSEFAESHSVARLIGAPPGYVGYGDMAMLSQALEKHSGGVLLLDEFEKAHPQVHRLFLQVLDAGRVTDSYGKTLDFGNMTIVATCNVGEDNKSPIGFSSNQQVIKPIVPLTKLKMVFPVELLNRFDEIVPFRALTREDCASIITSILVKKLNATILAEYEVELEFSAEAIGLILDRGFSTEFGARNLQRAFQDLVTSPLANSIDGLKGKKLAYAELRGDSIAIETR